MRCADSAGSLRRWCGFHGAALFNRPYWPAPVSSQPTTVVEDAMRLYRTIDGATLPSIVELALRPDLALGEPRVVVETELASEDGKVYPVSSPNSWRASDPEYSTVLGVLERAKAGQPSIVTLGGSRLRYERWDPAWQHHASDEVDEKRYVMTDFGRATVVPGAHGLTFRLARYAVWQVRLGVLTEAIETGDDLDLLRRAYDLSDQPLLITVAAAGTGFSDSMPAARDVQQEPAKGKTPHEANESPANG